MKKKTNGFFKTLLSYILGDQAGAIFDTMKAKVDETIQETERKVAVATKKVVQMLALFFIVLLGLVFVLVGLAQYLETLQPFQKGIGFLIVGGAIVVLAVIFRLFTGYKIVQQ